MPKTPHRTIRIDDELWSAAVEETARNNTTVTNVVKGSLTRYVARSRKANPPEESKS